MDRIRQLRKERGLSQVKLAVMADMDPATLNRLERGTGNPNLKTLQRIADALDVSVAEVLEDVSPKVSGRSSLEPTLNDVLEAERLSDWDAAVDEARQLREDGRIRMEELLTAWRASKERGDSPDERRRYLDEMVRLLDKALRAEEELWRIGVSGFFGPDKQQEFRAAGHFYGELLGMVERSGFRVEGGQAERIKRTHDEQPGQHRLVEAA